MVWRMSSLNEITNWLHDRLPAAAPNDLRATVNRRHAKNARNIPTFCESRMKVPGGGVMERDHYEQVLRVSLAKNCRALRGAVENVGRIA